MINILSSQPENYKNIIVNDCIEQIEIQFSYYKVTYIIGVDLPITVSYLHKCSWG